MAGAGARAYNGGMGAESPTAVQGRSLRWVVRGDKAPLKLTDTGKVFVLKAVIVDGSAAVLHETMYCLYFRQLT